MRGAPAVLVAHRVDVLVRVDPAGLAVRVPQRDLGTVGDLLRLALHDGAQAALQRGLEQWLLDSVLIGFTDYRLLSVTYCFLGLFCQSQISLRQSQCLLDLMTNWICDFMVLVPNYIMSVPDI